MVQDKTPIKSLPFFVVVIALLCLFPFPTALAVEYGGLGGRPAHPDPGIPNSSSWFIYQLKQGEVKEDAVEVQNNGVGQESVEVYAADSTPSSDGGFALKQRVETMTDLGAWVRFYPDDPPAPAKVAPGGIVALCNLTAVASPAPTDASISAAAGKKVKLTTVQTEQLIEWCKGKNLVELAIPAGQTATIPFVITVPNEAGVGEHAGGIVIQKKAATEQQQNGSALIITTRVGIRIYETVPGVITRQLTITKFSIKPGSNKSEYIITLGLLNSGNVSTENISTIDITDTLFHRSNSQTKKTLQALPGQELIINTPWAKPTLGRFAVRATISYQGNDQAEQLTSERLIIWVIPWTWVSIIGGLLLLIALVWITFWLWQKRRYSGQGWQTIIVKKGDTVQNLAENYQTKWQTIAKVNKLKPPYHLGLGGKILVPPITFKAKASSSTTAKKSTKDNNRSINN
jgi:hypothetical protein